MILFLSAGLTISWSLAPSHSPAAKDQKKRNGLSMGFIDFRVVLGGFSPSHCQGQFAAILPRRKIEANSTAKKTSDTIKVSALNSRSFISRLRIFQLCYAMSVSHSTGPGALSGPGPGGAGAGSPGSGATSGATAGTGPSPSSGITCTSPR